METSFPIAGILHIFDFQREITQICMIRSGKKIISGGGLRLNGGFDVRLEIVG